MTKGERKNLLEVNTLKKEKGVSSLLKVGQLSSLSAKDKVKSESSFQLRAPSKPLCSII